MTSNHKLIIFLSSLNSLKGALGQWTDWTLINTTQECLLLEFSKFAALAFGKESQVHIGTR